MNSNFKYEIICLLSNKEEEIKKEIQEKIQDLIGSSRLKVEKLRAERLAWPVEIDKYLVLNFETSPKIAKSIETEVLSPSKYISVFLLVNLNKKRRIKSRVKVNKKHERSNKPSETQIS